MVREILITLYLFFYRVLFTIFKLFPLKNKVVLIASFKDNNLYIFRELEKKQFPGEVVFLCKKGCFADINKAVSVPVFQIEAGKFIDEVKAAYHLMTAKTVIVDNYYGFLAVAQFRKEVECIQIWHAAGAIKNFGYLDPAVANRSRRAKKRFRKVYSNFHKVVVGSTAFAQIFEKAFDVKKDQFLPFGYPRTDFFFNESLHEERKAKFFEKYPMYQNKKIILYAPTYRPNKDDNRLVLDIQKMYEGLKGEYMLFIRMHPSVNLREWDDIKYKDIVADFSGKASINDLLIVSDYLITDYSSIPFEYVILNKPMIFYPYDLKEYANNPGLVDQYDNIVPGPIVFNTDELIHAIQSYEINKEKYRMFDLKWNEYNNGKSTQNMVQYIFNRHFVEDHEYSKLKAEGF